MSTEIEFRNWFRGRWAGWVDGREPRGQGSRAGWGSGNGAPDLTLGVRVAIRSFGGEDPATGGFKLAETIFILPLPCELKLAAFTHGDKLTCQSEVRENQRKWHARAAGAGVLTAFLWGVPHSGGLGFRPFILPAAGTVLNGWAPAGGYHELPQGELAIRGELEAWVAGKMMEKSCR